MQVVPACIIKRYVLVITLMVFCIYCDCAKGEQTPFVQEKAILLNAFFPRPIVTLGEEPILRLMVKNQSQSDIYVISTNPINDYRMKITTPTGVLIQEEIRGAGPFSDLPKFYSTAIKLMRPGDEYGTNYRLWQIKRNAAIGMHSVEASRVVNQYNPTNTTVLTSNVVPLLVCDSITNAYTFTAQLEKNVVAIGEKVILHMALQYTGENESDMIQSTNKYYNFKLLIQGPFGRIEEIDPLTNTITPVITNLTLGKAIEVYYPINEHFSLNVVGDYYITAYREVQRHNATGVDLVVAETVKLTVTKK